MVGKGFLMMRRSVRVDSVLPLPVVASWVLCALAVVVSSGVSKWM